MKLPHPEITFSFKKDNRKKKEKKIGNKFSFSLTKEATVCEANVTTTECHCLYKYTQKMQPFCFWLVSVLSCHVNRDTFVIVGTFSGFSLDNPQKGYVNRGLPC